MPLPPMKSARTRNVFVERLWRSVKYERVYLKAYDSVSAARADIADYLDWYNADRGHSSRDCPPRQPVRRKRRPPPWTTLHLCQSAQSLPFINREILFKQTEPLVKSHS